MTAAAELRRELDRIFPRSRRSVLRRLLALVGPRGRFFRTRVPARIMVRP